MFRIALIGHVSIDVNVKGRDVQRVPGGGVYYGSFAAKSVEDSVCVVTKGNPKDRELFRAMEDYGINVRWIECEATTSIENIYPSDNPDERVSRVAEKALPFREEDVRDVKAKVIHVTALWKGEFPEELIPVIRKNAEILGLDAQGFLRVVDSAGKMSYSDWEGKEEYLKDVDVFKVDIKEAWVLTGSENPEEALRKIARMGAKEILLTYKDGVYLYADGNIHHEKFEGWTFEGRTGRGDTCVGSYLAARLRKPPQDALKVAAQITSEKMRKPGPFMRKVKI